MIKAVTFDFWDTLVADDSESETLLIRIGTLAVRAGNDAAAAQAFVDLCRCVFLPRPALPEHLSVPWKLDKDVDMVGHHHKVAQLVSVTVEVTKAVRDNRRKLRTAKQAST